MNRITRYVFWELSKTFLVSLSVLTAIMVLIFVVQEAWRESLTPRTILSLIPFSIPTALSFTLPGTILFATCIVYGRMSASNEIVALKSLGISATRVVRPGLTVAFLLSLMTLLLSDIAATWGRRGVYNVILRSSAETIYAALSAHGAFNKGRLSILVDDVRGANLINPLIERDTAKAPERLRIQAESASIHVDPTNKNLVFQIRHGRLEYGDQMILSIDKEDIPIPLSDATRNSQFGRNPSNLNGREIRWESENQQQQIEGLKRGMALAASGQLLGGNWVGLSHPNWLNRWHDLDTKVHGQHRFRTEPWRRWASGFSCLCFVIVGAPLAIRLGKSDFWTVFAICFTPILLLYYPLLMFGVEQAKSGNLPPYFVWIGNVVMILIGGHLLHGIGRT